LDRSPYYELEWPDGADDDIYA